MSPTVDTSSLRARFDACVKYVHALLFDHAHFPVLAALVILGDAVLTQLIIHFVPYTEIDWETYMMQVELFLKGEQDYSRISGPTGPLVYPAGHVYIHQILSDYTSQGLDIPFAQQIYAVLYLASLIFTCAVYLQAGGIPNWAILLLPLSKRLHSIYVLRLFNDCWAAVAVQAAIWAYGRDRGEFVGTMLFSTALSVKMSVLLYVPGLLVVLVKKHGIIGAARHVGAIVFFQLLVGAPFLLENARTYVAGAFDLSRVFLYKWTVNWRFVSEQMFLSSSFSRALLASHLVLLLAFAAFKWTKRDGGASAVIRRAWSRPDLPPVLASVTADQVTTIMYTSNLIGILFARSLHYQFYAGYAQQLPFLAWRTRLPTPLKLVLLGVIEYAWNVFPSTSLSSGVLLGAHVVLLGGVWFGFPDGVPTVHPSKTAKKQ